MCRNCEGDVGVECICSFTMAQMGRDNRCLDQQYMYSTVLATDKKQKHSCKKMMGGLTGVLEPGESDAPPGKW
jgi:hypothetical protein